MRTQDDYRNDQWYYAYRPTDGEGTYASTTEPDVGPEEERPDHDVLHVWSGTSDFCGSLKAMEHLGECFGSRGKAALGTTSSIAYCQHLVQRLGIAFLDDLQVQP